MKFKLPKKVKHAWVKALRSGEYQQGQMALKTKMPDSPEVQFCCLGVAKEIGLCKQKENKDEYVEENFLPQSIQNNLSEKNDSGKWSFKKIANYIVKNL